MTKDETIKRRPTAVDGDIEIYGNFSEIEDLLDIELTLGQGKRRDDFHWKNKKASFGQFIAHITDHKVSASKDGPCFTQGSIVGERRKAVAMNQMDLLVLDMDTGQRIDEVRERILQEGLLAIIYTTHSNQATKTTVSKSQFYKKLKLGDDDKVTDKMCAMYLESFKRYTAEVAKTARFNKIEHTPDGIQIFIDHAPMEKYRIVFLLDEPYIFAEESANQTKAIDRWKKKYAGVANMLDAFYDQSCVDPSRLFYYPTHAEGKAYHVEIIVGEPLQLSNISDGDPRSMKAKVVHNAFTADAGGSDDDDYEESDYDPQTDWVQGWYTKNGPRFASADFLRDYFDVRMDDGIKVTVVCPFDHNHTDAGNPDDKGFYGANAGEWSVGDEAGKIGLMKCSHASCKGHHSWHFLDQIIAEGVLDTPDDLEAYLYDLKDQEEDEEESDSDSSPDTSSSADKTKKTEKAPPPPPWDDDDMSPEMQALAKEINKLSVGDGYSHIVDEIVGGNFNETERAALVSMIVKVMKGDVSRTDVLKMLNAKLRDALRQKKEDQDKEDGITSVYLTDDFDTQVKAVTKAFKRIAKSDKVHLFKTPDGHLARVSFVAGTGTAKLELLDRNQLFVALTDCVKFYRESGAGKSTQVAAPNDIVAYFSGIDADRIPLPVLNRVVKHPIFTDEGRLVSKSGFDIETGAFIDIPFKMLPVNESPSDRELDKAYDLIFNEVFVDFPFQDGEDMDGHASKANLLAMVIQPFIRDIIGTAATPLYVVNKPVAGAGSGKLVDCVSIIQTGEAVQTSQFTSNEEEIGKVITSRLKSDPASILFFDNVNVKVNSGSLASAITSGVYSARLLSTNTELKVQMQGIWAMSGIAMTFSTELARRVAPITLVPAEARPEDRQNFKHNDILQWVEDHRAELVWAVCTMIQAWVDDGMPHWKKPPIGSFERWSRNIGGILDSVGVEGFMDNSTDFRNDTSYESDADLEFVQYLFEDSITTIGKVWTAGEVFDGMWDDNDGLEIALPKVSGRNKNGMKGSFGAYIKKLVGRKFEVFDKDGEKRVIFVQRHRLDCARNVNSYILAEVAK